MNSVLRERQLIAVNLLARLRGQPIVAVPLAVCLLVLGLLFFVAIQRLGQQHSEALLAYLRDWPFFAWSALFLLCLAVQQPACRRERLSAQAGWMAAWPQMPAAMRVWSRWRSFAWAMLQSAALMALLGWMSSLASDQTVPRSLDYLLALAVPFLARAILPWTVRDSALPGRRRKRPERLAWRRGAFFEGAVIGQWHRTQYRSQCWSTGTRWSLGLILLIIPAGAAALQVAVAIVIGIALVQWSQFWSAGLKIIVQGSVLTRALPLSRRAFSVRLSRLPLISVAVLLPTLTLILAAAGMAWTAALLTSLILGSALILYLVAALAWRDELPATTWRNLAVLLLYCLLSTAIPFLMPVIWLLLMAGLIRLIAKEDK